MHQIQLEQRRRPVYEALIDSSKQANKMMKEEAKTQQDRHEQVNEAKELTVGGQEAEPATPRSSSTTSCAGCRKPIRDKFIFSVIELHWHQDCVQCSDCSLKLNERCYTFEGKLYCKLDYWRRFGPKCFACGEPIGRSELVQRIKGNRVYHLKCFTCNCCQKQLEAGEQLHLVDDMRLMCKQDFSQFTRSCSSSASSSAAGVMRAAGAGLKSRYYATLTSSRENRPADLKTLEAGEEGVPEEAADEEELEEEDEDDDEGVDEDDDDEDDEDELYQQQPFGRLDSSNLENEENRSTFGDNKPDDKVQVSGNGGQVNPLIKQQKHHYLASSGKRKGRRRQRGQPNRKQLLRNNGESILSGLGGGQQPVLASPSTNQLMHLQANQQPAQQQKQVSSPGSIGRHSSSAGHKPTRVRTVLNEKQLALLRECYQHNPRPDALRKESLVEETGLSARVIRVWFQNKRCKDKKKSILYKQMQQNEKDGRHLTSLMRGVHLVASSPIQYDDHSTVSSTPGGGLPADPGNPRADNSSSPPQHYAVPRSPGGGQQGPPQQQPLDVHAYQPAWKSLAEYAQQQAAAGADRMNPHSPRYQQLLGQIHGFNSNEPPPTSQQLDPTERLQQQPASFVGQQQQQATQNAYPPQAHGSLMEHHAHHMIQPAPMGHLHQFPRHC